MNTKIKILGIALMGVLMLNTSCKKDKTEEAPETTYSGTLTVLQKDAYSDVAGRSSKLWPAHTTTVFKWGGNEAQVQINHGTSPGEKDANGNEFLVEVKVYSFSGTKSKMESLQAEYKKATFDEDNNNKFLNLENGKSGIESSFLQGIKDYMEDGANGLSATGNATKDSLITLFGEGKYQKFAKLLPQFNWDKSNWTVVLETVLGDVLKNEGEKLSNYHVCNDDADLQVRLIKHYISTGKVEMPEKAFDGPMMFYTPE